MTTITGQALGPTGDGTITDQAVSLAVYAGATITAQMANLETITGQALDLTGDGHGHHIPGSPFDWRHPWVPLTPVAAKSHFGGKVPGTWHQEPAGDAGALQEEARQAAARAEAAVTDLAGKARALVPKLLGGGRADWNGKVALFDAKDRPAVAAYMGWDGTMGFQRELAGQLAKGTGDGKVTDPVAAFTPHIDVLHELIHSVVPAGGETPEWKALPQGHKAALAAFTALDKDNPSGGAYPTMHALADARKRDASITQETVDDLAARGLLAKSSTTTSTYNPVTGQSTPPVHLWTLTAKGSSALPVPQQTHDMHKDAYRDPRNAAIEEGFTELGTAHHAPEFLAAMGVGSRETAMVSVTSAGNPREKFDKADLAARKDEIAKLVAQANETTSASAELHLRTAAREMGKASPDVGLVIDQLSRAQFTAKDAALKAEIWQEMSALNLAPGTLSRATVTEYAKRLRDPDRIASGSAWGHYGWQTAAAQRWVLDAAKAEGKGKKSPRVRALADEINREGVGGKVPAMARQVIRAAGADPGKFQGAALAALETRIRYNWAQNPDEAKTSPWLMAMTAVRDYDSEH